jgi:thymidine kinase
MRLRKATGNFGDTGWIEVICGPMFSGKTEELIRRVTRAQFAKQEVQVFKPSIDTRYDVERVVSHSTLSVESTPVRNSTVLREEILHSAKVIAIDEVQFFDAEIVDVCLEIADRLGKRVIVAGLDMDSFGKPFGPMPALLAVAEEVLKVQAVCVVCGDEATRSYRKTHTQDQVAVGGMEAYEPRCRNCFKG